MAAIAALGKVEQWEEPGGVAGPAAILERRSQRLRAILERLRGRVGALEFIESERLDGPAPEGVAGYDLLPAAGALLLDGPAMLVKALQDDPEIDEVADADVEMGGVPASASGGASTPWHLPAVNAPATHATGCKGQKVLVGLADTGIEASHTEFQGTSVAYASVGPAGRVRKATPTESDPAGHGTRMAAIIAGKKFGVAPGADLAMVNLFHSGTPPSFAMVIAGLDWLARIPRPGGLVGADIINLSFESPTRNRSLRTVITFLRLLHIPVVAAIGNGGRGTHGSPGNFANVIGVGAFDVAGSEWKFSGSGRVPRPDNCDKPDLLAPGVDILAGAVGGGYTASTGTSEAAAVASDVGALLCCHMGGRVGLDPAIRRAVQPVRRSRPMLCVP